MKAPSQGVDRRRRPLRRSQPTARGRSAAASRAVVPPLSEGELIGGGAPLRKGPTPPQRRNAPRRCGGFSCEGWLRPAKPPRWRSRAVFRMRDHPHRKHLRNRQPSTNQGDDLRNRRALNHRRAGQRLRRRQRRQPNRRHHSRPNHTLRRLHPLRSNHRIRMRRRCDHHPSPSTPRRHLHRRRHRGELHGRLIPAKLLHLIRLRRSIRPPRPRHHPSAESQPGQDPDCDKRNTQRKGWKRQTRTHPTKGSDRKRPTPRIALKLPSIEW